MNNQFLNVFKHHCIQYHQDYKIFGGEPISSSILASSHSQPVGSKRTHIENFEQRMGFQHSKNRTDKSLGELTRKFINLLVESEDLSVDLNDAAEAL